MKTNDLLKLAFMRGVLKADVEAGISLQDHMKALEKRAGFWSWALPTLGGATVGGLLGGVSSPDPRNMMYGALAGGAAGLGLRGALGLRRGWRNLMKPAAQVAGQAATHSPLGGYGLAAAGGLGAGYLLNQYLSGQGQQQQQQQQQPPPQGMPMDPMGSAYQSVSQLPGYGMSYPGGY